MRFHSAAFMAFFILASIPAVGQASTVSSDDFQLVGPDGKVTARLTTSSAGTPSLFFFDNQGRDRMNLFLYPEGHGGIVLNDENEKAVGIFRMHGKTGRPVLVFKNNGQDRMVMGLRDDDTHAPYIEPFPVNPNEPARPSPISFINLFASAVVGLFAGIVGSRLFQKS